MDDVLNDQRMYQILSRGFFALYLNCSDLYGCRLSAKCHLVMKSVYEVYFVRVAVNVFFSKKKKFFLLIAVISLPFSSHHKTTFGA